MKKYVSEFDQWLRSYKQQHPQTEQQQREGRVRLWDKQPKEIEQPKSLIINKRRGYEYYD